MNKTFEKKPISEGIGTSNMCFFNSAFCYGNENYVLKL